MRVVTETATHAQTKTHDIRFSFTRLVLKFPYARHIITQTHILIHRHTYTPDILCHSALVAAAFRIASFAYL